MTTTLLTNDWARVRSVLGDTRDAVVNEGAGHPWITCPFCSSAIYLGDPHPEHENTSVSRNGRCANPWCLANPAMPLDAAREARGRAIVEEMEAAARRANHEAAMRRIRDEQAARQEAWNEIRAAATEAGACVGCAWHEFNLRGTRRLVRHRGPCPRAARERKA